MTDEDYRRFLSVLYDRYVRSRISHVRERFHHHMMEEWSYHLEQAERAAQALRFIELHARHDDDIYATFTTGKLASTVGDAQYGLEFANRTADEAGFLDAFDAHAFELLEGLQPSHLPAIDQQVMEEIGSPRPEQELAALVYLAKTVRRPLDRHQREVSTRKEIAGAEATIVEVKKQFDEALKSKGDGPREVPKKSRRWFKALGQISQGAALTIANVALAAGVLRFPVSPETQTWGAVASVTTGVGTILAGIGDLRNE